MSFLVFLVFTLGPPTLRLGWLGLGPPCELTSCSHLQGLAQRGLPWLGFAYSFSMASVSTHSMAIHPWWPLSRTSQQPGSQDAAQAATAEARRGQVTRRPDRTNLPVVKGREGFTKLPLSPQGVSECSATLAFPWGRGKQKQKRTKSQANPRKNSGSKGKVDGNLRYGRHTTWRKTQTVPDI